MFASIHSRLCNKAVDNEKTRGSILIPAIVILLLGNMLIAASLRHTGNLSRLTATFERQVSLQAVLRNVLFRVYSRARQLSVEASFDNYVARRELCGNLNHSHSENINSSCEASLLVASRRQLVEGVMKVLGNAQILVTIEVKDAMDDKISARVLLSRAPLGTARIAGVRLSY